MKLLTTLNNNYQFRRLKRTKKSRQVLRDQKVNYKGRVWLVMDYIDDAAAKVPPMLQPDGTPIDHQHRARQFYYKYDWKGVQYYFKALRRSLKYMKVQIQPNN